MDAENEADSIFFGIVRGLRRNSIYKPVIEVVTSVSLNQNSKVKVRKSAGLNSDFYFCVISSMKSYNLGALKYGFFLKLPLVT